MTKRNRNIKNIFIKLQFSTNIMANEVKTPIQNYFEKVLHENLTFQIPPLWFLEYQGGDRNKPLWSDVFLYYPQWNISCVTKLKYTLIISPQFTKSTENKTSNQKEKVRLSQKLIHWTCKRHIGTFYFQQSLYFLLLLLFFFWVKYILFSSFAK